ncbi:MAG: hypothetical protein JO184_19850 [Gammaproteobacteria bacterium]|nr:hypothetical protein [Gammaproteobacteria bacterium]
MPETYEKWLAKANDAERILRESGVTVVHIHVDIGVLERWCTRNARPNDGAARAAYAAEEGRKTV